MGFELNNFNDPDLQTDYLEYLIEQESADRHRHFSRLWDYVRNPISPIVGVAADAMNANSRPYFQAQEVGLPARITGINRFGSAGQQVTNLSRKEVVIENDIAWRVNTMVDFLFGKPISIRSLAEDKALAEIIELIIENLFEANGGGGFFSELALLGAVYGFVDVILRTPPQWPFSTDASLSTRRLLEGSDTALRAPASTQPAEQDDSPSRSSSPPVLPFSKARREALVEAVRQLSLEPIEAPRIIPILDEDDFRTARYWVQCYQKRKCQVDSSPRGFFSLLRPGRSGMQPKTVEVVEIIGPHWWQRYEDRSLVAEGPNSLGRIPVVHIQNIALPGSYEGLSDVEPLIPLQDELNTRLSDRAYRITYQSFKMYLAKGIDDFLERPVGPGQMWSTHNPDASIEEFGQDSGSPSENIHIEQVRHALDKTSGVTPLAAGLISGKVGNLTSATALKVLLSGLISKTNKKRITYGRGLAEIISLVLEVLDKAALIKTDPQDRRVEIHWPSPLPEDESQRLADAQVKAALGVPTERILAELGYDRDKLSTQNQDEEINNNG